MTRRIALIHAVAVAMQPIEDAFHRHWPEAERVNLLDDSLAVDRARSADLTPAMFDRIDTLARYTYGTGAHAILFTCSAFGPAIEAAAKNLDVPVLKPNEAMFDAALHHGKRIGMIATFAPSVASMEAEFLERARAHGSQACIKTICVPEAMAALRNGDAGRHNALVADAAGRLGACDAIMLAQFSTSRAREAVTAGITVPVLTSPDSAVLELRRIVG